MLCAAKDDLTAGLYDALGGARHRNGGDLNDPAK